MSEDECYKLPEDQAKVMYTRLYMIDYENDEFDCAFDYLTKITSEDKDYKPVAMNYLIADSLLMDGQADKALSHFEKCLEILKSSGDLEKQEKEHLNILYTGFVFSYVKLKEFGKAKEYKAMIL